MTLVKRSVKGSALTHPEVDGNWDHVIDRANHGGTQSLNTISDAGTLSGLNSVDTGQIVNKAVTFAKMQDVPQSTFMARVSAGTGVVEPVTPAQAAAELPVATATAKGQLPPLGTTAGYIKHDGAGGVSTGDPLSGGTAIPDMSEAVAGDDKLLAFNTSATGAAGLRTADQFVADRGLVTATGVQTLTGKTLTDPKSSYAMFAAGTKTTGTYTPALSDGNMQAAVNGGAHTLGVPVTNGTFVIQYTNNASAGAITASGFTRVTGSAFTTTDGHDFLCYITVAGAFSHLNVVALQ